MATITIQLTDGRTKTLSASELRGAALLFLAVLILVTFPVRRIIDARNAAALRPAMERIAARGGADADMWLFWHFNEGWRLPAAAAAGDPAAQYLQGRLLIYRGQRRTGLRLIRRAAAVGYPCAVMRADLQRACE